jgi:hypothetical protein
LLSVKKNITTQQVAGERCTITGALLSSNVRQKMIKYETVTIDHYGQFRKLLDDTEGVSNREADSYKDNYRFLEQWIYEFHHGYYDVLTFKGGKLIKIESMIPK